MNKKEINFDTYKRKGMYDVFSSKSYPVFSTTFNIDITNFKAVVQTKNLRFFATLAYIISEVVNEIPEFKQRIIEDKIYEYEVTSPGFTVLVNEDEFSFCFTEFDKNFDVFYENILKDIDKVMHKKDESDDDKNHMFFITSIPWFSFTSFTHPYDKKNGSVPIITIGKYFSENDILKLPVAIQVNHAIMDGLHVGKFHNKLQSRLLTFGFNPS